MSRKRVISLAVMFMLILQICTIPLTVTSVSALVKSGLQTVNGKTYFYVKGKKLTNAWKNVKGYRYYFGKNGVAYKGYKKVGADRYYFDSKCHMLKDKTVKINGKKYYFLQDGKAAKAAVMLSNKKIWKVSTGGKLLKDITAFAKEGQNFDVLVQKAGQPKKSQNMSSCMGPGQDGIYTYDNFQVYTYEENGARTITGVWVTEMVHTAAAA